MNFMFKISSINVINPDNNIKNYSSFFHTKHKEMKKKVWQQGKSSISKISKEPEIFFVGAIGIWIVQFES